MALKVPIFKIHLNVANQNTSHYADYNLTLAHDPELDERNLIIKICLFSYLSHLDIELTKDSFMEERPICWKIGYDGLVSVCADLGKKNDKQIKHLGHHSGKAHLFLLNTDDEMVWFNKEEHMIKKLKNISLYNIEQDVDYDFSSVISRSLSPSVTIDGEDMWMAIADETYAFKIKKLI